MAGGPQTYIVAGTKVPSRYLAVGSLVAYVAAAMMMTRGGPEVPIADQIKALDKDESAFVTKYMEKLAKEDTPAKAHH
ncbi:hypothetical protein AMAG_06846 [Allomyces macrogynus ATCC 38327]|uniref:Uncharacterized protein n=1 Tax=Allomyces macrogynus (strain ATCC 38327) TaxID=578462 RepID=A0A0L0SF72_ALLM3|nr:hypothetical protein AMAG_06846 [Allomyces macrogynus ATCC 38327]|eukprot:KNE61092.1 hypothetical protein AMAG_06846 [Allomyces macrogynus ATCC 38327]